MVDNREPRRRGFVIGGVNERLPQVPPGLLNTGEILTEGARLGEEGAISSYNQAELDRKVRVSTGKMEAELFAVATRRNDQGLYKHVSRLRGQKKSIWTEDNGTEVSIDFRTRRGEVVEVEHFDAITGDTSIDIAFQNGQIERVEYEYDPARLAGHKEGGTATAWELWMDEAINERGLRKGLDPLKWRGGIPDPGIRGGLTFYTTPRLLDVYSYFGEWNPSLEILTGKSTRTWRFNAQKNRFNQRDSDDTAEELEALVQADAKGDEAKAREIRKIIGSHRQHPPLISADEFSEGLALLLDTVQIIY